jgi:hypothetical protein
MLPNCAGHRPLPAAQQASAQEGRHQDDHLPGEPAATRALCDDTSVHVHWLRRQPAAVSRRCRLPPLPLSLGSHPAAAVMARCLACDAGCRQSCCRQAQPESGQCWSCTAGTSPADQSLEAAPASQQPRVSCCACCKAQPPCPPQADNSSRPCSRRSASCREHQRRGDSSCTRC